MTDDLRYNLVYTVRIIIIKNIKTRELHYSYSRACIVLVYSDSCSFIMRISNITKTTF